MESNSEQNPTHSEERNVESDNTPLLENLVTEVKEYERTDIVNDWIQEQEPSEGIQPSGDVHPSDNIEPIPTASCGTNDLMSTIESSIHNSMPLCAGTLNLVSQRYEPSEGIQPSGDVHPSDNIEPIPTASCGTNGLMSTIESSIHNSMPLCAGTLNLVSQRYESLDYDTCENVLFLEEERKNNAKAQKTSSTCPYPWQCLKDTVASTEVLRWFVILIVAMLTAVTASVITMAIEELSSLKFSFLKKCVDACAGYSCLSSALAYWLIICAVSVAIGSILVTFVAPVAAGSGIPVIKCYLNGVKVPEVVRIKTLFVKAFGVVSSVVGGLAVGKEGPMIHCGAVIAAGISQGKSTTFRRDCKIFEKFREDHEKRDFVSAGAAAGVAAAFGAPVGGVLFSLEEGASFWNQALTWRIFFCSMTSFFTLNIILSTYHLHPGQLSYPGLLNFGKFDNLSYSVFELPMYILMGAIGGLLGALYNQLNFKLTVFRLRYVKNRFAKVLEAVVVSAVGVGIAFITIVFCSDCQTLGKDPIKYTIQLNCSDGDYNSFGAIWFQTPEASLRSIFHDPDGSWSPETLAIFFVCYYILGCWTYGLSISSGLFIPTLLIGAAWGRLMGIGVSHLYRACEMDETSVYPAKFAIVGAAAMLGGVVRMTISLTVILMEAIGNITFGLPIMISVMTAKWIGDFFNEGLYDIHIQLSSVPILPWEPPPYSYHIYASKIMSSPVICFRSVEKIGIIVDILKSETHNGFPVVDYAEDSFDGRHTFGIFRGMILRWQLIVLLQHKIFNTDRHWRHSEKLSLKDFRDAYPRHPPIQRLHVSPFEESCSLDLRPYMNPSAYTITSKASLPRIFRLFRALGLRHLPVVNDRNSVVGIVTRKDIARFRAKWHYGKLNLEELHISYS